MFQILIVEDSKNTARLMKAVLKRAGYEVHEAGNGAEALEIMDKQHIDLIVLDIMMPVMDGYKFTEQMRAAGDNTPILMVTAKDLPEEKCKGFIVGTDDYMVKPVNEEELVLRIKALLRRSQIASEHRLKIGKVSLDYDSFTVNVNGEEILLPQKEFKLLYLLLSNPGRIYTRIQLMDEIWGTDTDTGWETVTVHIGRLRKRFENIKEFEIVSVRGLGYKAVKKV